MFEKSSNIYDEYYRELFETIIENLEDANLGLDDSHAVEEASF